jgi:hypothetical protein
MLEKSHWINEASCRGGSLSPSVAENMAALPVNLTEATFTRVIIAYAQAHGWLVYHQRPAITAKGWRTAVQGNPGFPDLVLARKSVIVIAELKRKHGKMTESQIAWMRAFGWPIRLPSGVIVRLWTPDDWEDIKDVLR